MKLECKKENGKNVENLKRTLSCHLLWSVSDKRQMDRGYGFLLKR